MYFEAMASVHVCCSTADLAAFLFVRFLLSALIAYFGAKSSAVNKPCVHYMSVLYRPMRTISLPLSCIALRDRGRLLKRVQHCLVMQLLYSKLLPCNQPCSLASFQVTTCTHFVHGNHYPYLHLHLALHCSTGALLHRSSGKLRKHNRSCCQRTYCAALDVCDLVYTWHHIAPRPYTRVLMPV